MALGTRLWSCLSVHAPALSLAPAGRLADLARTCQGRPAGLPAHCPSASSVGGVEVDGNDVKLDEEGFMMPDKVWSSFSFVKRYLFCVEAEGV